MSGAGNGDGIRDRAAGIPVIGRLLRHRFVKFGAVGSSGTIINFAVLYIGQEHLYRWVQPEQKRLTVSLVTAITLATFNNFMWNRHWTWGDRKEGNEKGFFVQMGQYYVACWLAIMLQFVITKMLAAHIHYLAANLTAIALSGGVNFLMNHRWTFSFRDREGRK